MLNALWLIPLTPFLGFVLNGFFGRRGGKRFVTAVAILASLGAALFGTWAVIDYHRQYDSGERHLNVVYNWFASGNVAADIAFQLDPLSIVMLMVVTWVGFLIHVYSFGYMSHEEGYWRYFAYLNLFLAMMLILILASNYLFMFVGWEGVGLCSYLLIGFYYEKEFAAAAGKKAFIVNRVGDFGFLVAMLLMLAYLGSVDFGRVQQVAMAGGVAPAVITAICLLLFLGATGKSAQIPLYIWLPDAMAGPTPVSALIHAATMVTAGVYMVARSNVLYRLSPTAMMVVAIVGALTALVAATIALRQNDIKKVLAYSTVSQLGFMFIGVGVGAFAAGIFHLTTHAFFKACLFLGAGAVIHAMSGEQDIRRMGGLRGKIPITSWTFLVATIAIAGFPPFAGFFSKDEILAAAWATPYFPAVGKLVYLLGAIAALFTAFYMFRLYFLTFSGRFRGTPEQETHIHESPPSMTVPLVILAFLSMVGGMIGLPHVLGHNWIGESLHPVILEMPSAHGLYISATVEWMVMAMSTVLAIAGFVLARKLYREREVPADQAFAERLPRLARAVENKYYVDEAYEKVIVQPLEIGSRFLWKIIDAFIDGIAAMIAFVVRGFGDLLRFFQTGNVRNYALMFFIGVVVFMWVLR
ncbi:MAG TPA: NADH-quinone oxidoreductase subunit L [Thermoanaerobaculia bacterium]|nr:NADH-quinone oxidoreductase subunit L [Thermoanaerobaculia bacterium]